MASTMLTGDRRWAPARKSGMTVLGKVPKPINLPSQRLENHGLDPNVEIVPKGTLTWGSRPSSTVPNAWGSSSLVSPNTDGSSGSPCHVSGRPSSGGSGTRPSTAGSDISYEHASNAWGPNSRPSSASGTLTSNQSSIMATRPRSAETRPSSSSSTPLSRFAETPNESTVAWGTTRTAERVGAASSKTNMFTLSSGDFPTLGSDKNSELQMQRGHSFHGRPASASGTAAVHKEEPRPLSAGHSSHGRPGSASGTPATHKEAPRPLSAGGNVNAYSECGNVDSGKADGYPYVGRAALPNMNWQRDPQEAHPYPSANIPPQQFGPWRNAPVYSPEGVWNRGGAVGGPYRPAGSPGSYPVEPYPYYPPQFPARPPPNSDPVPSPGADPCGYSPKNGESYHHHQPPDLYVIPSHSVIPVRPGVYPSSVPYEGYYGPPNASFGNSSAREVPIAGMTDQPGVYDQRPNQNANLEPGKLHARPVGRASVMANEQKESQLAHETRPGQYKVLLKQHDGREDKNDAPEKREQSVIATPPHVVRGTTTREEEWRRNRRKDERTVFVKSVPGQEASTNPASDWEGHSSDPVTAKSLVNSSKAINENPESKPEIASFAVRDRQQSPANKNNASLIEKIEGLNNKARNADAPREGEEKTEPFKVANKADHSTKLIPTIATSTGYTPTPGTVTSVSEDLDASTEYRNQISYSGEKLLPRPSESHAYAVSKSDSSEVGAKHHSQVHRRAHAMRGRVDDHPRLRSNSQDVDEWAKKSPRRDSSVMTTVTDGENGHGISVLDCHASEEATEESYHEANTAGLSYATSSLDSMDHKAQRAKLKEIAMRRAKELQKEEEERIREQKAKALAKLEELNKRTSAHSSSQNNQDLPPNDDVQNKQDFGANADVKTDAIIIEATGPSSAQNSYSLIQVNDSGIRNPAGSTDLSMGTASQVPISATRGSAISQDPSLSVGQENSYAEIVTHSNSSDLHDNNLSKRKQMGSRRRPNISQEEILSEKPVAADSPESPNNTGEVAVPISSSDSLPNNEETSMHHRKKNNRNARNKNKLDENLTSSTLPTKSATTGSLEKGPTDVGNTQPLTSVAEATPDPSQSFSETMVNQGSITSFNQGQSEATEKVHGRVGNQSKPQSFRKSTRNQQAIKPVDKFHGSDAVIWAPVRPSNKNEPSEEVSQKITTETNNRSSGKNGHDVRNGMKTKRAEMERYVPKPVVKELLQQDNSQAPSPSLDQVSSGNMTGKQDTESKSFECSVIDGSALTKPDLSTGIKSGDSNKPNRRGKMRASWRQRSSTESPSALHSTSAGDSSYPTNPVLEPSDQNQPLPEQQLQYDEWNSNNNNLVPTEKVTLPAVLKDEGAPSRQRRPQFVVHKIEGSNSNIAGNKDPHSGAVDKTAPQSAALDSTESDRRNALRAKRQSAGGEHMRSHWQPKYQSYSHNPRHESSGDVGQRIASEGIRFDKEFHSPGIENYSLQDEYNSAPTQITGSVERRSAHYQEATNRGKKVLLDQSKEQTPFVNQDLLTNAALAPANVNEQHEQPVSSAPRRQGRHNSHFNRGQDAGKQIDHTNGEKQKGSSHFEYQRIGSYNKTGHSFRQNPDIGEEAQEGPRGRGLRYKERGQNYSRRGGHLYGQRSGASVQVNDSYNSGE